MLKGASKFKTLTRVGRMHEKGGATILERVLPLREASHGIEGRHNWRRRPTFGGRAKYRRERLA